MKNSSVMFFCLVLCGCASTLNITYRSDPPGASIYEGNALMGRAPFEGHYAISESDKKIGYVQIRPVTAKWISGATATFSPGRVSITDGASKIYTFRRPANTPGAEKDSNYAIQLQQLEYAKRQAEAAESAAYEARRTREAAEKRQKDAEFYNTTNSGPRSIMIDNGKTLTPCIRAGSIIDCN